MSRIDHDRPELRLRDNLRRELSKSSLDRCEVEPGGYWPPYMQPVAAKPKALRAFLDLFQAIEKWFAAETDSFSFAEPPEEVVLAFESFAVAKVSNKYDNLYSGCDWLCEAEINTGPQPGDLRPALLVLLRAANLMDEHGS